MGSIRVGGRSAGSLNTPERAVTLRLTDDGLDFRRVEMIAVDLEIGNILVRRDHGIDDARRSFEARLDRIYFLPVERSKAQEIIAIALRRQHGRGKREPNKRHDDGEKKHAARSAELESPAASHAAEKDP